MSGQVLAITVAGFLCTSVIGAMAGLIGGSPYGRASVPEMARLGWLALTGQLKPWRGVADPIMMAARYSRFGLTPDQVNQWRPVIFGFGLDARTERLADLIHDGWTPQDYASLGRDWYDIDYITRAVRRGMTAQDLLALSRTGLSAIAVAAIADLSASREDAMNWLTSPLARVKGSEACLYQVPEGQPLRDEIARWRAALGPDASWFWAAGLTLEEARAASMTSGGLDTAKIMASLRTPAMSGSAYTS